VESPYTKAVRLITALEEMAGQENILLRSLDLVEAVQICERAAPLVDTLCALAADPGVATLQSRIGELVAARRRNATMLDAHLARLQQELRRIDEARVRLARVTPAYGSTAAAPAESRLNTAA